MTQSRKHPKTPMFKIRKSVAREDQVRALLPERAYAKQLLKEDGTLWVGNVLVDARRLVDGRFCCDTRHCVRSTKKGRLKGSCCTDLEVNLTPNEIAMVRRLARRYLVCDGADPRSPVHDIARVVADSDDGWLELNYREEPTLSHNRKKKCALGFIAEDGRLLCAMNAMAEALGEPLEKCKFMTCYVFPLHYVEYEDDKYLLTIINSDNHEHLDADEAIGKLRCIRKPPDDAPPAYRFLKGEIEYLLGKRFYRALCQAVDRRDHPATE